MRKITEKGHFHLPPLLVWTIVWALFFATLLLGWERLPNGDFAGQFHSFGLFQMRQFALGKLPLWSPGSFAGFPFAADTQSATFYPLRWLTLLLSLPGGFTYQMLTLEGLFHIWLAGIFTYALAFDMTRQRTAALIAATAFGLGGYLTSYPLLQLAILETMTWLPLVLLLLRRGVLNGKRPLPKLAAAAIVLGMAALVGHPQTFLHISYMAAAYYLFLSSRARWTWRWRLGLGSAIVLIAIGTTLIAAYPAWQYFRLTTRSDVGYEFVSHGFPLLNYLHLLLPRTLSLWTPEYVGLLPLALALLALWGRRYSKQSAEILFWGVVTAVAAWASLGDKGIIFQAIYRIVPGFSLFRQQERLVNLVSLSLALLAAQGFALFCQLSLPERRKLLQKVTPVIVGGLLLGGFSLAMAHPIVNDDWLFTWGRQLLLAVVILSLLWFSGKRRTTYLFVGLLALDLFVPIRAAMSLQTGSPDLFWPQPAWLTTLKADNPGRIDSRQLFHANVGEIYDLADVRGISPLQPQLVNRFESLPRPLRWQLLHVTHVVATTPIEPSLTAVAPIEQNIMPGEALAATLFRFEEALPHAWLSSQPIIVPDAEAAFQALQDPDFDATQQVILTEPLPLDLADVSVPETMPQVETVRTAANQLSLVVETAVPTVLVISEWALPGWQAVIDGKDISLLTVNYGLLGLPLAAGSHQIELSYTPPGLLLGTVATAVTLLLSIMLAWRWQPIISRQSTSQPKPIPLPAFPWNWQTLTARVAKSVRQHWRPFMFATIFLGFGLRLFSLGQQELPGDEAFSYLFARMPLAEIIPTLLAEGDSHSPLHYLLLHGWMKLVGDSELALRFLSLLPGVLLLPLLAQLGRRIGGRPFALLLTLLLAISQSHVWISQDVRNQYTLGLLLIVSATLLLTKLVDEEWGGGINGRFSNTFSRWGWLLYALLSTLAVYSHYYT
ncbi:MAG: YfhO family protein, partial [Chloroflexi bacterium]|nr:YfhO family protein [Chloroflexota bacterium]